MRRSIRKRIKEIARERNLPESIVQKAFECQFKMARENIQALDLINLTEEEFNETKTNYNWKYLGKLIVKYPTIKKLKEKWEQN